MKEKKLYRLIEVVGALVITVILAVLLVIDNRLSYVYQSFCKVPNLIFAGIILVGFGGYSVLQKKKRLVGKGHVEENAETTPVRKLKIQLERRNLLLASMVFLGVQLLVAWQIYFKTGWDCGKLVQMAQEIAYNYRDIGDDLYFSMYPNNVLLVAVFAVVLRFTKFLGFHADYFPLVMIGCLLVNLAGFFMADCIRKLTNKHWIALAAWNLYVILVGLSPWISIPYSDTYSILFPILGIWLYINKTEKNQYLVWGLIGFSGLIGYFIKPTVIFVFLILVVLEICHFFFKFRRLEIKTTLKRATVWCIVMGVSVLLAVGVNDIARYKMGCTPNENKKFTPMHYLMMGLNYKTGGTYDQWDVNFSAAAPSVEARNEQAYYQIRYRLSQMGVKGLGAHLSRKLLTNFNDGTFAWGREGEFYWNMQEKNTGLSTALRNYYYESGSAYPVFQVITQAMWILVLCLMVCLMIPGKGNPDRTTAAVVLSVLAIICFVMLFEARARYLYLYSPVFILAAALGLQRFLEKTSPDENACPAGKLQEK